jgi:hypothetical protein
METKEIEINPLPLDAGNVEATPVQPSPPKRNLLGRIFSKDEPVVYQFTNPLLAKFNPSAYLKRIRWIVYIFYFVLLLSIILFIYFGNYAASVEGESPTILTCFSKYRHLEEPSSGIRRELLCPGGCLKVRNWQPSYIASERLSGKAVIIGGEDSIYRGDSWICPAAMHAGFIGNDGGGIIVETVETNSTYKGGDRNGMASIPFDSSYPIAIKISAPLSCRFCIDQAFNSVIFLTLISILIPFLPLSKRAVFWTVISIGWMYQVFLSTGIAIVVTT